MSTWCGSIVPHDGHVWGIEGNPGEDGPDLFMCDGADAKFLARWRRMNEIPPTTIRLGPRDTSQWELP